MSNHLFVLISTVTKENTAFWQANTQNTLSHNAVSHHLSEICETILIQCQGKGLSLSYTVKGIFT